jgi:DNA-binding transcriptional regulator LsrR (DeoR family)
VSPKKDKAKEEKEAALAAYYLVNSPAGTGDQKQRAQALVEAVKLGSVATLNRRLKTARDKGWIEEVRVFRLLPNKLLEILAGTQEEAAQQTIRQHWGEKWLRDVVVAPSWPLKVEQGPSTEDLAGVDMAIVGRAAAHHFFTRLPRIDRMGLGHGRTLRGFLKSTEDLCTVVEEVDRKPERLVVAVFGSLSFDTRTEMHEEWFEAGAPYLANRLANLLRCKRMFLESPVHAPLEFFRQGGVNPDAVATAKRFVESLPNYRTILLGESDQPAVVETLDTLITSVGDLKTSFDSLDPNSSLKAPFLSEEERRQLRAEAVGEILGRYIVPDGSTGAAGTISHKINERVFGLGLEHLERIVERAADRDPPAPGVIVVASSREKAKVVQALLNRKGKPVISELIISGELARELIRLEGIRGKRRQARAAM